MESSKTGGEMVLVTGGSGFLGGWCLKSFYSAGTGSARP